MKDLGEYVRAVPFLLWCPGITNASVIVAKFFLDFDSTYIRVQKYSSVGVFPALLLAFMVLQETPWGNLIDAMVTRE